TSPVPSTTIAPQETSPRRPTAVKCFASIFYISSPSPPKPRITFSHFAMTVSVDQCARTCHEFNCAIAHYDPATGRCQFNPSTAFALKKGQCPAWPAPHYRNNVVTPQPLRIFCVQCHRSRPSGRRGSIRRQHIGGHYRTRFLKTQYTGR
uniref:Apple domain-containing protein n=1 Tax=Syphacia muris TaxID=451379 RepID=A0A0N5ASE0_9BILA